MDETLTLAEIVNAVHGQLSSDRATLERRIRHWSLAGVLPTAGAVHAGSGRHRRYKRDAVYIAAILERLADWGLPIGALKSVSYSLDDLRKRGEGEDSWQAAILGRRPVYICFITYSPTDQPKLHGGVFMFLTEEGMVERVKRVPEGMYLNITTLFKEVTL